MSKSAFTTIWSTLGIVALYMSTNALLRAQGSELYFPFPMLSEAARYAATAYGMMVSIPVLLLLITLTRYYASAYGKARWSTRMPVAFNLDIDPENDERLGPHYQGAFLLGFLLLPVFLQILLLVKFFEGTIEHEDHGYVFARDIWGHLGIRTETGAFIPPDVFSGDYRYGGVDCGIDFYPVVESWLFLLLVVLLISYTGFFVIQLRNPMDHEKKKSSA